MIYTDMYNSIVRAEDSLEAVKWFLMNTPLTEVNQTGWDAVSSSVDSALKELSVTEKKLGILKRCNEKHKNEE